MYMKKLYFLISCLLISSFGFSQLTPPTELQPYYSGVDFQNLAGTPLYDDLAAETISKHTTILSYSDRHDYLYDADEDLSNSSNVILMYSGESRSETEYLSGNNPSQPQTFNTEHVYPQSLIGNTAKGDLHHLRSCDTDINSARSNNPFASGSGSYANLGSSWYPGDEWKGDVARMIMYLNLKYNEPFSDVGSLNLFLQWNTEDPVSAFEDQRNAIISNTQGNRNPFIDNPYIATVIWGGNAAENRWSGTAGVDEELLGNIKLFPNPSDGNTITVSSKENLRLTFFDILGKKVLEGTSTTINKTVDVSILRTGIYFVKLENETGSTTKKFIKN